MNQAIPLLMRVHPTNHAGPAAENLPERVGSCESFSKRLVIVKVVVPRKEECILWAWECILWMFSPQLLKFFIISCHDPEKKPVANRNAASSLMVRFSQVTSLGLIEYDRSAINMKSLKP